MHIGKYNTGGHYVAHCKGRTAVAQVRRGLEPGICSWADVARPVRAARCRSSSAPRRRPRKLPRPRWRPPTSGRRSRRRATRRATRRRAYENEPSRRAPSLTRFCAALLDDAGGVAADKFAQKSRSPPRGTSGTGAALHAPQSKPERKGPAPSRSRPCAQCSRAWCRSSRCCSTKMTVCVDQPGAAGRDRRSIVAAEFDNLCGHRVFDSSRRGPLEARRRAAPPAARGCRVRQGCYRFGADERNFRRGDALKGATRAAAGGEGCSKMRATRARPRRSRRRATATATGRLVYELMTGKRRVGRRLVQGRRAGPGRVQRAHPHDPLRRAGRRFGGRAARRRR